MLDTNQRLRLEYSLIECEDVKDHRAIEVTETLSHRVQETNVHAIHSDMFQVLLSNETRYI